MKQLYVGIDLAASPKRYTFFSSIATSPLGKSILNIEFSRLKEDEELIEKTTSISPRIIVIDAPLSLGNVDEKGFRPLDRCALRLGARLLPLKTPGMMQLAMRGAMLAKRLAVRGFLVLETHPSSAARILGYRSTVELVKYIAGKELSRGAADAVVAGMVGLLFDKGEVVTCEGNPPLVLPLREARIDVS